MKAKYLLRGLGLGMIITAVVMGAYTRSAVADARVAVLKEYGIGEEATLAETLVDVGGTESNAEESMTKPQESIVVAESDLEENAAVTVSDDEKSEMESQMVPDTEETDSEEPLDVSSENQEDESAQAADGQAGTVTIEISRGDVSESVARKLESAGLVENAQEFNAFLKQHGYDRRISTGTKTINMGASWQEMADGITH